MTPTPTDPSEQDRETADKLIHCWQARSYPGPQHFRDDIATALTRARAEGVREGLERAAKMLGEADHILCEACACIGDDEWNKAPYSFWNNDAIDLINHLRALADSSAPQRD